MATSSVYIFVVDLSKVYSAKDVFSEIESISARIRATWQFVEETTVNRSLFNFYNIKPVILLFTKLDVFVQEVDGRIDLGYDVIYAQERKAQIAINGSIENLSNLSSIDPEDYSKFKYFNEAMFKDIISFFKNKTNSFKVSYVSMSLKGDDGRLGIAGLLKDILPK